MNHLFPILTALAYLVSFGLYIRFLGTGNKLTGRLGTLLLGLGLIVHYFALLERSRGLHTVPYHDLYGSMSLFGCSFWPRISLQRTGFRLPPHMELSLRFT